MLSIDINCKPDLSYSGKILKVGSLLKLRIVLEIESLDSFNYYSVVMVT